MGCRKISVFLLFTLLSQLVFAGSSVFTVSKGKNKIIIGGTIHLLRPTDFPLPKEFEHAFANTRMVLFESDLSVAASPEFAQRLARQMRLKNGKTVDQFLQPKLWSKLTAYSDKHGFPLHSMKSFNAAFISIMMTVYEAQRIGASGGVEAHFSKNMEGKLVGELEDEEEVVQVMRSLARVDANSVMSSTIRDLENLSETMDMVVDAWRKGRTEKLYKRLGADMREENPAVYNTLVVQRNKRWLPKIESLFNTPETEFILVGAMHLAGPDSLLKMLKNNGYKVRKYRAFLSSPQQNEPAKS
ncbi:MAG: TraB/GumN family protein [Cellvibrionaceae bacterium]|nr:TraB/GumN family protein [Cellvibrionaceae bacterium]